MMRSNVIRRRLLFVTVMLTICVHHTVNNRLAVADEKPANQNATREPILIADFEGEDYGKWKVDGNAFGKRPAAGTLAGQMHVEGFAGKGLVNSFEGGDGGTGRLTSPPFKIERKFVKFLIGGGGWPDETCMNLIIDGKTVRTATGSNGPETGSGTERLEPAAWDVTEFAGREATIVIVDQHQGGWGHINVDQIVQTDDRGTAPIVVPPLPLAKDVTHEIVIARKLLHFPVKNGGKRRVLTVSVDGKKLHRFDIELAEGNADWWAPLDVSQFAGKRLTIVADTLPQGSKVLESLRQADELLDAQNLYHEPLRSQFHFSSKRGWLNDPNGLVFFRDEYHLFYQHNPYGVSWGNMHWGHATSRDLVHWKEHGDVLAPDELGPMFSGSAVVDKNNSSGFGKDGKPPLVLIYTAAGDPTTQCIAYSNDGRNFTKYTGNPVIKQISGGNRDPKVFWHEGTKKWVMVFYVEMPGKQHSIHFFTSPNLRDWTLASITNGGIDADKYLFECPDFFELPVDGNSSQKKWVLTAANSEYAIGTFDGTTFKPEVSRLPDVRGRGYYAAQTFSDTPDGRRIQIGWCFAESPGMPFNLLQSIPSELSLRTTPNGVRLARKPVKELDSLRDGGNQADSLANFRSELIELTMEFDADDADIVELNIRGATIKYDAKKQELMVNDQFAPAPFIEGKQRLRIYVDKTILEVFASDGFTYLTLPFIPKQEEQSVAVKVQGGKGKLKSMQVYKLKSSWEQVTNK